MFNLTDKQLDLLKGLAILIARPVLWLVGLTVVAYWLLTDFGIPALIKAVQK